MRRVPAAHSRLAALLLVAAVLAGCSGGSPSDDSAAPLDVDADTGGIRGIVVDESIRPITGALVEFLCTGTSNVTGEDGTFSVVDVAPGACIVRASHPLYDVVQLSVDVVAGDGDPPLLKVLLTRVIFAEPYSTVQDFRGFLVCSIGFFLYASEECGEGVGVPRNSCFVIDTDPVPCVANPVLPGERLGSTGANQAQWDFWLDGPFARTLIVEMQWKASSPTLKEFELNLGNDWVCDPFCNGNQLNITGGPSPLYMTVDFPRELTTKDGDPTELSADTRFSTFIWGNWGSGDPEQLNVALNQAYDIFATTFYYVPAPDGFSFIAGDERPF